MYGIVQNKLTKCTLGIGNHIDSINTESCKFIPLPMIFENCLLPPGVLGRWFDSARETALFRHFYTLRRGPRSSSPRSKQDNFYTD